jgi:hypothetical protein
VARQPLPCARHLIDARGSSLHGIASAFVRGAGFPVTTETWGTPHVFQLSPSAPAACTRVLFSSGEKGCMDLQLNPFAVLSFLVASAILTNASSVLTIIQRGQMRCHSSPGVLACQMRRGSTWGRCKTMRPGASALPKTLGWTSGHISAEGTDCTPSPLADIGLKRAAYSLRLSPAFGSGACLAVSKR